MISTQCNIWFNPQENLKFPEITGLKDKMLEELNKPGICGEKKADDISSVDPSSD